MPGVVAAACQAGIVQTCEIPPPPAPFSPKLPMAPDPPSFQTVSTGGKVAAFRLVPPTDVANGCEAGSLTDRDVFDVSLRKQVSEPASPEAATKVWPCRAASSKRMFSVWMSPGAASAIWVSHRP